MSHARARRSPSRRGHCPFLTKAIAPSGKKISYEEAIVLRLDDGKIVEHWAVADALTMMRQIGAIPE